MTVSELREVNGLLALWHRHMNLLPIKQRDFALRNRCEIRMRELGLTGFEELIEPENPQDGPDAA